MTCPLLSYLQSPCGCVPPYQASGSLSAFPVGARTRQPLIRDWASPLNRARRWWWLTCVVFQTTGFSAGMPTCVLTNHSLLSFSMPCLSSTRPYAGVDLHDEECLRRLLSTLGANSENRAWCWNIEPGFVLLILDPLIQPYRRRYYPRRRLGVKESTPTP